jgi:hypothetical protein
MGLEPIRVELTDFNKLELLREEEERLGEEIAGLERQIRDGMLASARQEFLMSLSPYYAAQGGAQVDASQLKELESRRQMTSKALEAVTGLREKLEQALGAAPAAGRKGTGAAKTRTGSRSSGFESFEDFRQARG